VKRTAPGRSTAGSDLPHITIECVRPELDGGRYPVKRLLGDRVSVTADIFKDGHDILAARVRYRGPCEEKWRTAPLLPDGQQNDGWVGQFQVDRIGRWTFTVEGWTDVFGTWRSEIEKKVTAGQDVSSELLEGAELIAATARRAKFGMARETLKRAGVLLRDASLDQGMRVSAALALELQLEMEAEFSPGDLTSYQHELGVWVDRQRAGFAAWYEMFPRSTAEAPGEHGTFADAERHLPRLANLGFDVIYLPPIHPIGTTNRKGKNNALTAGPDDPGSPWAIGNEHGGHTAVDPRLGTLEDFEHFVQQAGTLGMEIALDYALQCSPDHPWLKEHPDWFFIRPDGTLKYAENPPKKYQDIYPLNFWCKDREGLWNACRDIFLFWAERGVRTFRVDNPHTKPFMFWEWAIAEVQERYPDTVFLAEAFTKPKRMKSLAKLGFTQSYTYFTWRNSAEELRKYVTELTTPPVAEYMRGNFFTNTPDILNEYLVAGGRPAFRIRLLLAGTLLPVYGIYSGFELIENVPLKPGSEEYLNSEKYEVRLRNFAAPGNLNADVRRLNAIRRNEPALQLYANLTFHHSDYEPILFYRKAAPTPVPVAEGQTVPHEEVGGDLLIVVNTDPYQAHESMLNVPIDALGIGANEAYIVEDLLTGARYTWRGVRNYVRLDPKLQPGHIFRVHRFT
jgi:starch synthase (maltosyl-transferring)